MATKPERKSGGARLARHAPALLALAWSASCAAETLVFDADELVAPSAASPGSGAPCLEITDDGVAHLLWVMGPSGDQGIFVASSPPGAGYGPATRLDSALPASIDYGMFRGPTLRSSGPYLAAGWKNQMADAPLPIWAARSTTMGASWEAAQRADPGPVGPGEFRDFQAVAIFPDGRMAQAWMLTDTMLGTTLFEWAAQDATGAFGPPVIATGAAPGQPCECCYPDELVLADGATVLVAWRGNDANLRTIHVARSTDGGASFPEDHPVDTSGWMINACPATGPSLAADGTTVLVTWMSGAGGATRAWLAKSTDGGSTWSPMTQVDDFGGTRSLNYPEVALRGTMAVVTWEGRRTDGGRGIFASVSTDAGSSWGPSVLVSDDMAGSARMSPTVAIAPDFGVEIAWTDARLGEARVFRARGRTATAAGPFVLREKLTAPLPGSLPAIAALLSDGVAEYRPLFGGSLPFTDPEPVLLPSAGATLVFYAFDDPGTPLIGVVKDPAASSVQVVER
jgi:hypothetical protein